MGRRHRGEVNGWRSQWTKSHVCVVRVFAPPYRPFWVRAFDAAVTERRELANGRADLLDEQAGLMTGVASVSPVTNAYRLAARLLVTAGADVDALPHWVEIGRQRASPMHRM